MKKLLVTGYKGFIGLNLYNTLIDLGYTVIGIDDEYIIDDWKLNLSNILSSQKFDGILAVTSANKSNHEASISADEVKKYFTNSKLALLIDGGISKEKTPSTVVKIFDKKITILRQGLINIS